MFSFPLRWDALENEVVKLIPFISRDHGNLLWSKFEPDREGIMRWLPFAAPSTLDKFLTFVESLNSFKDKNAIAFAIVDKTRPDEGGFGGGLAGLLGLLNTSEEHLRTEVAPVLTLPAYQGTHVTANAVGLLLRYCLNLPSDREVPGLGLRRVAWTTSPLNIGSQKTAEKLGFVKEGMSRWKWIMPMEKQSLGNLPHPEATDRRPGRDSVDYAICWDDWEGGVREVVEERMASTRQRSRKVI